jgi:transposase
MLNLPCSVRIFLAHQPCDLRKGIDALCAQVRALDLDAFSGHLFVFVSKGRDRIKILCWDEGGFVVYYKRLEQGRFKLPRPQPGEHTAQIDAASLTMLLQGIDLTRVGRPRLWQPARQAS